MMIQAKEPKVLVMGWFSFELMGATAGDLIVRDIASRWLREARIQFDVALAPPFRGGISWNEVDPAGYTDLVFVCGPFGEGKPITGVLERFAHCRVHGLDLSLLQSLEEWNPFHFLAARDSSAADNPDLAFLGIPEPVPVVGVIKVHRQKEYKSRGLHDRAHELIDQLLEEREVSRVEIDTRLDINATNLRTSAEVTSLISRMDAVVTTRLHGCVLALAQGVPALAVDPIEGGAKVARQMRTIGWPALVVAENASPEDLAEAFTYCLSESARLQAQQCASRALERIATIGDEFRAVLADL